MVHAPIELGAIVAAGISHDRIVVGDGPRERIPGVGGPLVRRIALAGLERAPRRLQTQIAVTCAERGALSWSGRKVDLRFQLRDDGHAAPAVRCKVMPDANTEARNVARNTQFGSLIENRWIENVAGDVDR